MREIEVRELPYLPLGHQGENEAQRIVWRGLADSWRGCTARASSR